MNTILMIIIEKYNETINCNMIRKKWRFKGNCFVLYVVSDGTPLPLEANFMKSGKFVCIDKFII